MTGSKGGIDKQKDGESEEFNPLSFEKRLLQLKDTQESIQALSSWCLQQRHHHKKIVASWLNVLKRAKIDQRLTLFYLANDVIQYSKRKNYEFVDSWGTTLQKATPLVRDEKVKHRILRIFKIWETRNVYDEEFLTDLTGLLSAATGKQPDSDPSEFQPMQLVNKIKQCSVLEADTDQQLRNIHESTLALKDIDVLCVSLKERHDAEEAAKEVEEGVVRLEGYVRALQKELVARAALCHILQVAMQHYGVQRGEVKVVANAYRSFGSRVRNLKRRLDELCDTLPSSAQTTNATNKMGNSRVSPVPSPPQPGEAVPSPGPDEDIDLPHDGGEDSYNLDKTFSASILGEEIGRGFSSFMGHAEFPFFNNDNTETSAGSKIEVISSHPKSASDEDFNINDFLKSLIQPKAGVEESRFSAGVSVLTPPPPPPILPGLDLLSPPAPAKAPPMAVTPTSKLAPPPPPPMINNFYGTNNLDPVGVPAPEPYIPDHGPQWNSSPWENALETPESPPHADAVSNMSVPPPVYTEHPPPPPRSDVDHRSLTHIAQPPITQHNPILEGDDVDLRVLPPPVHPQVNNVDRNRSHKGDVDHRNLISLTGTLPPPPAPPMIGAWSPHRQNMDQDYRNIGDMTSLIPPPPLPQLRRSSSLRESPPPSKMSKSAPSTPQMLVSSLPPNMPSHTPDMTKLPPVIHDMTKLPPSLSAPPPPMMPPIIPDMTHHLPLGMHILPPGFPSDLAQVPLPPSMPMHLPNMPLHLPPGMPLHPVQNMMSMSAQFSSHVNDQSEGGNTSVSHLPPSSMLKHPPDVLNQNHRIPPHHGMPLNMPLLQSPMMHQGPMMGRPQRTDIVESIDMEMSDDESLEDDYSHMHRNKLFPNNNNRVLVGGDPTYSSYNNKPVPHFQPPKGDNAFTGKAQQDRSNLVRINSISEEEMKKDEKKEEVISKSSVSDEFLLSENLISDDDDDFFNEIGSLDDDDKTNKSPDIFDEVLLSSSNPENPNTKSNTKESLTAKSQVNQSPAKAEEVVVVETVEDLKEEPAKWVERAGSINPSRPTLLGRPPAMRASPRFRHQSIFQRIPRAPHPNEYYNPEYRPRAIIRRPWGARPPRGYW